MRGTPMKTTLNSHLIHASMMAVFLLSSPLLAEQSGTLEAPPSAEDISESQPLQLKTQTVYETKFLPGVRLCEEDEVDYRGDFRKVNCQDEEMINAVSTRKEDPYNNAKPNTIVSDRIEPNGNIFRINFRRKATVVENTSDN